jgi:molybdopterin/thiamine biosynthesis adenylyltransferase
MSDGRYSRQEALFGQVGQARLAATRVAIVGLGGLGCHVAQQLAYAGVTDYVLADPDTVSQSNLNRLVGALAADAERGRAKVEVAGRMICAIQPSARVQFAEGLAAAGGRDVLFSCVDSDRIRLELTTACARHRTPFFDLASDTGRDWYGGRVLFSGSGKRCGVCMDLFNQNALREETEGQRRERAAIYGVDVDALADSGPAVISINGLVASLAVTEFLKWRTGLDDPIALATYRADLGVVRTSRDDPQADCYYCAGWRAAAA